MFAPSVELPAGLNNGLIYGPGPRGIWNFADATFVLLAAHFSTSDILTMASAHTAFSATIRSGSSSRTDSRKPACGMLPH